MINTLNKTGWQFAGLFFARKSKIFNPKGICIFAPH